jgi:glutathione S-transferase
MTTPDLTLHVDTFYISPYAMSVFVALEEKFLPYTVQTVPLHERGQHQPSYRARTHRVPVLRHDDYWLAESSAICEYLAEAFPFPDHPRIFPTDLRERGICREVQAFVRSDLMAIREERPANTVWYATPTAPLSPAGKLAASKLVEFATALIPDRRTSLFDAWCIADVDLAMMLQRLNQNRDPLPANLVAYAEAQWQRPSIVRWCALPRAPYVPY